MCSIENGIKFSVNVRYRPNHHRHYHPPHYWAIQGIIVDKKIQHPWHVIHFKNGKNSICTICGFICDQ